MKTKFTVMLAVLIFPLSMFAGPSLNRTEAAAKLQSAPQLSALRYPAIPSLSEEEIINGFKQGLWNAEKQGVWAGQRNASVVITGLLPKGAEIFEIVQAEHVLKVRSPVDVTVEVTGVTDEPLASNIKHVEFQWTNHATGIAKQFLRQGGRGSADFQLYDDGWRVGHVALTFSDMRVSLDPNDVGAIQRAMAGAAEPPTVYSTNPSYFTTTQRIDENAYPMGSWSNIPGVIVSPYPPHILMRVYNARSGVFVTDPVANQMFHHP